MSRATTSSRSRDTHTIEQGAGPFGAGDSSPDVHPEMMPQYGVSSILAIWAAAALPMAALSWVAAPMLSRAFGGDAPLVSALLVCMTAGLLWQFILVLLLVHRERGTLRWSVVRDALWLRAPTSPRNGRSGGRTWLVLIPFIVLFGAEQFIPSLPIPGGRDFSVFIESATGHDFFHGSFGWLAVVAAMGLFNTVLGEELLFRGFLLPRMQGRFGRADWLVNGILFALYHLHTPWVIPTTLIDTVALALPTKRYRSAWMGIAIHSTQTVSITLTVLAVVA
jgi:membrane protease YdiL (CAAX protease family)